MTDWFADPFADHEPGGPPNGKANGHGNGYAGNGYDRDADPGTAPRISPWCFDGQSYPTWSFWLNRELPPADWLLGEVISTTSRAMLVGPTGLGKTHFAMALAGQQVLGRDFLHWRTPRPARVLYIEGEMSRRLDQRRLIDLARRTGTHCDSLILMSHEDFPDMPPLNTPQGHAYLDAAIKWLEGPNGEHGYVDEIIFDNLGSLFAGEMREPQQWAAWRLKAQDLTRRKIGQLYLHHTNGDGRGYGDTTREWGLDVLLVMLPVDRPDADLAFQLQFPKARERTPENRVDFEEAVITLTNDEWSSDRGGGDSRGDGSAGKRSRGRPSKAAKTEDIALRALEEALAKVGQPIFGYAAIPPDTLCVKRDMWFAHFRQSYIGDIDPTSLARRFRELSTKLQAEQRIGYSNPWVWQLDR